MFRSSFIRLSAVLLALAGPGALAQEVGPSQLKIVEGKARFDEETGFVRIAGEIHNLSPHWILTPRIEVRLFDAAGKLINVESIMTAVAKDLGRDEAFDTAYAERNFTPPGDVAVFEYIRDARKLGGKYSSHQLTVSARAVTGAPKVAIEAFSAPKAADGWYSAGGRIKNTGTVGCRSPKAVIGLYGSDGRLYGVAEAEPDEYFQKDLAPGQSVAFEIKSIQNPGNAIATVRAWADCGRTD